ncbi:hypothetical protein GCM10022221_35210 [Actinocorallia aurea]
MRFLAPALLLLLAACGTESARPASTPGPPGRHTGVGTVLEKAESGPRFCSVVRESLPPQCDGPEIVGWDWNAVPHRSQNDVRWGEYTVVGTWDGTRLTLTEPPGRP